MQTQNMLDGMPGPWGELGRRQLVDRRTVGHDDEAAWKTLVAHQRVEREELHEANRVANHARYRRERPLDAFCDDFVQYLPTAILKTLAGFVAALALLALTFYLLG